MRRYTHSSEAAKEKSDMPLHVGIEQVSCSPRVCVCVRVRTTFTLSLFPY